ncbi:MAG: glycosyltransferase family 9 protein [Blastocatellia bacterium]
MSLPAMRAIRRAYPHHDLILLTDQHPGKGFVSSWEVLEATRLFARVLFYTPPAKGLKSWLPLLQLAHQIRQYRPEALFCLRDPHWNHARRDRFFFQGLCRIRHCYGVAAQAYQTFGRRNPSGHLIRYPREIDFLFGIVGGAGIPVPEPGAAEFNLPLSDKERSRIDSLWNEKNIADDALLIGIGPGSKMPAKRWPLDRFIEVGKWVSSNFCNARLLILGGPEDRALGDAFRQALGDRVVNLAGDLSILESTEALRRCRVYVGNDTGTMHLAAAAGTPCVAIFSARDHPGRWDPYVPDHIVLRTEPPCAGCLLEVCSEQGMRCLNDITVPAVSEAVRSLMNRG